MNKNLVSKISKDRISGNEALFAIVWKKTCLIIKDFLSCKLLIKINSSFIIKTLRNSNQIFKNSCNIFQTMLNIMIIKMHIETHHKSNFKNRNKTL